MNGTVLLVPLDGSAVAEAALPYAEAVAAATGASLRLLAVAERGTAETADRAEAAQQRLQHLRQDELAQHLAGVAGAVRARGVAVSTEVVTGDPVDEILVAADEPDVAMTVMATHGRGAPARLIVGSVADKVMRMSTRPTLLVRPHDPPAETRPVVLTRVMVPLDGSPLAETALPLATELAAASGATLTLVRLEPFLSMDLAPYDTGADIARLEEGTVLAAEAYLEQIRNGLPAGVHGETIVLRGFPATALTDFATKEGVDLVVMATHGRGGLRRLAMGSTADRMVRSGAPTLLIRAAVAETGAPTTTLRAWHCATCGRLITAEPAAEARCPRCEMHLHRCANCLFWDTTGCVLQRAEAYNPTWPGRDCPRFTFRETARPAGAPQVTELGEVR